MELKEYVCCKCQWTGSNRNNKKCPICNHPIEPVQDEPLQTYFKNIFNWNKI